MRKEWKVQIIYTQIDRTANNIPVFKPFYFNYEPSEYIYPASTVKLPVALLALQRLNEMKFPGIDRNTAMVTDAEYSKQTPVYNDPTTSDGKPSIAQYIRKILLVSDNDAYNRLYEFLGQEYINSQLARLGYTSAEIVHRLEVFLTPDENRHTNPVRFIGPAGNVIFTQPMKFNEKTFPPRNDFIGTAHYKNGELVNQPLNFSAKNKLSLDDLTGILKSVLFPETLPEKQRFGLTADDYAFVRKYMSQFPSETRTPEYDTATNWDAYAKFLLYGTEKGKLPKNIRIFNKIGDAYGCLTDAAYIVDLDRNIEFMLSARIYCNRDGVLNDDKYDYDAIGFPFMKQLGKTVYDFEVKRSRPVKPDLSKFKIVYEK
ncbi:MAG: serine hydrolase [Gemmatimonadaceae bacterium]|nr:serine hydrolase [Chitinophagaceae bacterium]